ncbi:MAG TPA: hypothetical protein VG966_03125 [Hyphomicrobiaceae bacterium]|nr:hypothetical protein [Hyphomicrobiaceae bacterium]
MREQSSSDQRSHAKNPASPAAAWSWWGPGLACGADWSSKCRESYVAFGGQWQDFVSRRIEEDLRFLQHLADARTPDAVWSAHARFWQRAAQDYAYEYAVMARFAGDFMSSSMMATQRTLGEAAASMPALSKAA